MPTNRKTLTEAGIARERSAPAGMRKEISDIMAVGLVLRITDKRAKSWAVYYYDRNDAADAGKPKHKRLTLGRWPDIGVATARELAAETQKAVRQGLPPDYYEEQRQRARQRLQADTFGAVAKNFMQGPAADFRTKNDMQRQLDRDVLPHWRGHPIRDITRADVRGLLAKRGGNHSRNATLALVRQIFNWAMEEELIDTTPISRKMVAKVTARERVLKNSEIVRIWAALDKLNEPYGALYRMLFLTGTRRSEVEKMTWQEVDGDKWSIPGARAKSGRGYLIHLAPLALDILGSVPHFAGCEFVFTAAGRSPVDGWSKAKRQLDRLIAEATAKEAGEPLDMEKHAITDWRLHDLRRTFATGLRSLGFDRLLVSQCLNHAEGGGATKIYDRFADDEGKARAWNAWAAHIETLTGGTPQDNVIALRG